ncbi:putative solute-binding protein [Alkalimarinus coralli]|uniref:putative solute-binding protein n=1 Tax=Alkalimarinus coralli TaxID=2935863 RepID=UPI00202B4A62|nr:putative solute-binding protein [Alkalimarinus coralli]
MNVGTTKINHLIKPRRNTVFSALLLHSLVFALVSSLTAQAIAQPSANTHSTRTNKVEVQERSFCVWDPVGTGGPVVSMVKELIPKSMSWGVKLNIEAYTDEKVAANDFKGKACDAVLLTDASIRDFNHFTSTVNAVGAIPGEPELRTLLTTLSSPKAAKLMRQDHYEIAGILPIGPVFVFVRDKAIDNVEQFQGQKMAVLNGDPVGTKMVRRVGGSPVPSSLANFAGMFNNGSVDIVFAPAVAFNTMELYKGLEAGGGILEYPLLHTSLQIVIHHALFPDDYGQKLRDYSLSRLDSMLAIVKAAESEIPDEYWIKIAETDKSKYNEYMRDSRLSLRDEGLYEPKALRLMRKVRCKHTPSDGECASKIE